MEKRNDGATEPLFVSCMATSRSCFCLQVHYRLPTSWLFVSDSQGLEPSLSSAVRPAALTSFRVVTDDSVASGETGLRVGTGIHAVLCLFF